MFFCLHYVRNVNAERSTANGNNKKEIKKIVALYTSFAKSLNFCTVIYIYDLIIDTV